MWLPPFGVSTWLTEVNSCNPDYCLELLLAVQIADGPNEKGDYWYRETEPEAI